MPMLKNYANGVHVTFEKKKKIKIVPNCSDKCSFCYLLLQGLLHRIATLRLAYAITYKTSLTSLTGDGFMDEHGLEAQDPVQITHRNPTQVSTKSRILIVFNTVTYSTFLFNGERQVRNRFCFFLCWLFMEW